MCTETLKDKPQWFSDKRVNDVRLLCVTEGVHALKRSRYLTLRLFNATRKILSDNISLALLISPRVVWLDYVSSKSHDCFHLLSIFHCSVEPSHAHFPNDNRYYVE